MMLDARHYDETARICRALWRAAQRCCACARSMFAFAEFFDILIKMLMFSMLLLALSCCLRERLRFRDIVADAADALLMLPHVSPTIRFHCTE